MKKLFSLILGALGAVASQASTFTFQPSDTDIADFDHRSAYTWGITDAALKNQLSSGYAITSATITIANLYNWSALDTTNQLFMHLLDNPKTGLKSIIDDPNDNGVNQGVLSDYFGGKIPGNLVNGKYVAYGLTNDAAGNVIPTGNTNIYLTQYNDTDGPNSVINYAYGFSAAQIGTLTSYILNAHTGGTYYADFGIGFDPDCHYFNNGIKFTVNTAPVSVPDGGVTVMLIGFGLLGMAAIRRLLRS